MTNLKSNANQQRSEKLAGNKNAQRDEVKRDAMIYIRVPTETKNRFVKIAQDNGQRLSDWMLDAAEKQFSEQQSKKEGNK